MAARDRGVAAGRDEKTRRFCPGLRRAAAYMTEENKCESTTLVRRGQYLPYPCNVSQLEEGDDTEEDFRGQVDEEH